MLLKNMKLKYKIIFLASFIILIFSALILFYIIPKTNGIIEERTISKLKDIIDLPVAEIDRQNRLVAEGVKTIEEAQTEALLAIENMRYNEAEYFWVTDMNNVMLMHPTNPALNLTDMSEFQDPDGKFCLKKC